MKLSELIKKSKIEYDVNMNFDSNDIEINSIEIDNRKCKKGSAFVCIEGYVTDGHKYAEDAVKKGAGLIVAKSPESLEKYSFKLDGNNAAVIYFKDTRYALSALSAAINNNPTEKINLVGITGTKGKTSTTYMLRSIYKEAAILTGVIGTMGTQIGDEAVPTERTTPEANVLHDLFSKMKSRGINDCFMEVSSQGLHLERVGHCSFSTAVFTNLSKDHIGENEHSDMDDYAAAKAKLFSKCKRALINIDSPYHEVMLESAKKSGAQIFTYGIDKDADFKAVNIEKNHNSVKYDIKICEKLYTIFVPVPGKFTVYNSLAAFLTAVLEGVSPEIAAKGLEKVFIPGKAENVPTGRDFSVLIDYAHNPDSFINILTTVKEYAKRTVFLFGCGGDRNRPRALMGETAGRYADFTIITSDNPRSEDPETIIRDIEKGIIPTKSDYICITDRKQAIEFAIKNARAGDVIILAGKGHETEQIFADRTIHFDEREIVRDILKEME